MDLYSDNVIKIINRHLPKDGNEWDLVGLINKDKEILSFGHDSKIIAILFEILIENTLKESCEELGYKLRKSSNQANYPDYYFIKPNGKRIAIDIKTTYRKFNKNNEVLKFGFTAGSFTSFMRNGTKNIDGEYKDYDSHYILGILYSREEKATVGKTSLDNLSNIIPAYKKPEVFIQEKFRICGDKKGSGNTDNIGTIKSNSIKTFTEGKGPFYFMGEDAFHDYWKNHPRYKDSEYEKKELYSNIPEYLNWLKHKDLELEREYREKYNQYIEYIKNIS